MTKYEAGALAPEHLVGTDAGDGQPDAGVGYLDLADRFRWHFMCYYRTAVREGV
jgi:hypothetical protein